MCKMAPNLLSIKIQGATCCYNGLGMFSLHHLSEMIVYPKGGIDSKEYIQTLDDTLLPFIEQLFSKIDEGNMIAVISQDAYSFMQDNAPCYTSKLY